MGYMSNMAALCKFVASHGLVAKEESAEEKAARIEREKKEAEEKKARQEKYDSYCRFWEDKYAQISDSSAIMNLEYALNEVFIWACKWRSPERFADWKVNLRYPVAHCETLLKTHPDVVLKHLRHLAHEAYYGKGRYSCDNKTPEEEMRRIHRAGEVANYYLHCGCWFV